MNRIQESLCIALTLLVVPVCHAYEWETQGMAGYYFPSDGFWDNGWSGEAKVIAWDNNTGVALSAGMMQWAVQNKQNVAIDTALHKRWQTWQGDVQYFPLGVSLLQRFNLDESDGELSKLQMEAGLHYLFASNNLDVIQKDSVWVGPGSTFNTTYLPASATCDDALVARLGGSIQWNMGEQTFGLLSGGYQFDLTQGDATADSLSVKQALDLSAFYVHFGVAFMWQ